MFSIRAYRETPSIEILCDGPNLPQGMPAAIRMEEGLAFIDPAPKKQAVELTSPEATALALAGVGMSNLAISQRLSHWYGHEYIIAVDSLYDKLEKNTWGTREAMIASAFAKKFLIGDIAPQLWLDPGLREDFCRLTALLSTDRSPTEIAELFKTSPSEIHSTLSRIAIDLDFEFMDHPATAFVTLTGMGELLPARRDSPASELMTPMTPAHERLFSTQGLYFRPFSERYPETAVRFDNQPSNLVEADPAKGHADQILIGGAIIDVRDVTFIGGNGETTQLTPTELTYLALKSVGMTDKDVYNLLAVNSYALANFYNKLLPPHEGKQRPRALEQAILAAFEKGVFVSRREPDICLKDHWRKRLFEITALAAQGKTSEQITQEMEVSPGTVNFNTSELQRMLDVKGTASLVLIVMAQRFYGRTAAAGRQAEAA